MTDTRYDSIPDFLDALGDALLARRLSASEIVAEVRADLEAQVERFRAEGDTEEAALGRALSEVGNPYELAHRMAQELPPFGGAALTTVRYGLAAVVMIWALFMLWALRPGLYGFDPVFLGLVALLHFPVILLAWPRVVWRVHWLFGLLPVGLGLTIVLATVFVGVSSESSVASVAEVGGPLVSTAPVTPVVVEPGSNRATANLVVLGLCVLSVGMLASMQQRAQRRVAILALVLGVGVVETVFQGEEFLFRRQLVALRAQADKARSEDPPESGSELIERLAADVSLRAQGEEVLLSWERPLSPGHSLLGTLLGDRIWVQD